MRNNAFIGLRRAMAPVLAAALALTGGVAVTAAMSGPAAQAKEIGSGGLNGSRVTGGGNGNSITETMPSGVRVSITSPRIVLPSYTGRFLPQTGYSNPNTGFTIKSDWTSPANAPTGAIWAMPDSMNQMLPYVPVEGKTVQLPQSYFNTNRFIDTNTFTITLDPPVANPVFNMAMAGWAVGNQDNVYITKPFGKLTISGATGQNGYSIPVTMSKVAGWDYGGFRFLWSSDGRSMEDPTPAADLNRHWIQGNNYSGGTTQFNSGGVPVSSISFVAANAWAQRGSLTTAYANNWGFQLNAPQSVSALTRLTGNSAYGDVTHTITDQGVRLGNSVQEGNRSRYVNGASSGTASDNSDAGMDALRGWSLPTASVGTPYTIEGIPVSNTSNRTLALQGWIDFNGNGRFDAGESSALVNIAPGQTRATLTWTVPATVAASGKQALRLRYGPAEQIANQPTGMASMGEVEDYPAMVPTQQAANLSVTKSTATNPVTAGNRITYYLDVRNNSTSSVSGIVVNDTIPTQITDFSASGTQGSVYNSSRDFSWNIGTLAAGATARVTITGTVVAATPTGTTITNTATVTSPLGCAGNNCSSTVRDVVQEGKVSNISVLKTNTLTGSNPVVTPGQAFTYNISVTNNSQVIARNLVINDRLPDGLMYVPVAGDGWTFSGQLGTFTIAQLNPGERQILQLRVRVAATASGTLRNVSVVNGITPLDDCSQNPSLDGCGVDPNPPRVDPAPLFIHKDNSVGGGAIAQGTEFTYTITVQNGGSVIARNVRVTDILPDELGFPAGSQSGWTISGKSALSDPFDLAGGASRQLTLKVVALSPTSDSVVNTVMAEKDEAGLNSLSSSSAVKAAEQRLDACIDGKTSGTCTSDAHPISEITAPNPTPTDNGSVWDQPAPITVSGKVWHGSGDNVKPGSTFWEQLTLTNTGKTDQTITVKASIPAGTTVNLNENYGWSVAGSVASMDQKVTIKAGSSAWVYYGPKVGSSTANGQSLPVAFTVDGSDPSKCQAVSDSCMMASSPVKVQR